MRVLFDVIVPYSTDIEHALRVLQKAFDEQKASIPGIADGPRVLGVQEMNETGVFLRVWATAKPMEQWSVERQLKMIARKALDDAGVDPPVTHQRIIIDRFSDPVGSQAEEGGECEA